MTNWTQEDADAIARIFWKGAAYLFILGLVLLLFATFVEAREIDTIIVHHSDSGDVSAAEIDRWHRTERGFDEIGYHFVIRADGTVEDGRSVDVMGAHAKAGGRNHGSIGICLTGRDTFTDQQVRSLSTLEGRLLKEYPTIRSIEVHHKDCP